MTDTMGFDFKAGVPLRQIPEGAIVAGHVGDDEVVLSGAATSSSRSARTARTITGRWPTA